jgi:small subunit ribosomal protein S3
MGQKVNPIGMRLGINRSWDSIWFLKKEKSIPEFIKQDFEIRKIVLNFFENKKSYDAFIAKCTKSDADKETTTKTQSESKPKVELKGNKATKTRTVVSHVQIDRINKKGARTIEVSVFTSRPALWIRKEEDGLTNENKLKTLLELKYNSRDKKIYTFEIKIIKLNKPELVATIVANRIADQLENRASFRKAQRTAIDSAEKGGAIGIKTLISGRLGGAEIARSEGYSKGQIPLHTLRADIDYAVAEANTTYGILGVKVWINTGFLEPGQFRTVNTADSKQKPSYDNKPRRDNQRDNNRPFVPANKPAGQGEAVQRKRTPRPNLDKPKVGE